MNRAILSIGSNLEPRVMRIEDAVHWMECHFHVENSSSIYETPEIHGIGRPYMNMVMDITTADDYEDLQQAIKKFEISSGRDGEARLRGDVPIDIDIVVWNDEVLRPKDYSQSFFRIGASMIDVGYGEV